MASVYFATPERAYNAPAALSPLNSPYNPFIVPVIFGKPASTVSPPLCPSPAPISTRFCEMSSQVVFSKYIAGDVFSTLNQTNPTGGIYAPPPAINEPTAIISSLPHNVPLSCDCFSRDILCSQSQVSIKALCICKLGLHGYTRTYRSYGHIHDVITGHTIKGKINIICKASDRIICFLTRNRNSKCVRNNNICLYLQLLVDLVLLIIPLIVVMFAVAFL